MSRQYSMESDGGLDDDESSDLVVSEDLVIQDADVDDDEDNADSPNALQHALSHPEESPSSNCLQPQEAEADISSLGLQCSTQKKKKNKQDVRHDGDGTLPSLAPNTLDAKENSESCFSSSDWSRLHLSKALLKALADMGFDRPTAIQREAIPFALQGRDILGTAQTGSGKTAAFLLPILERLCQAPAVRQRRRTSFGTIQGGAFATKALILLPTRVRRRRNISIESCYLMELAVQCFAMLEGFAKYTPITQVLVTGGMNQHSQEASFRQRPDIVVATPGRVLDLLLNSPSVHMELLEIVVLDEADRLLEMGFKDECLNVLNHCSKARQTMLFSATLSEAIKDLALLSLRRPLRIDTSQSHSLPKALQQVLVPVPTEDDTQREAMLMHLCFEAYPKQRTIIFFRTKKQAHRASLIFSLCSIPHAELHGNLPQAKRLEALHLFDGASSVRFLLCSELAARGLDIASVDLVINVSVPPETSRYVHQVGRTARIGKSGTAVTLFSPKEKLALKRIVKAASKGSSCASVLKRVVTPSALKKWEKKLSELEPKIKTRLKEEHLERELRLAEMELQKATNMQEHADEIILRPRKRWLSKADRFPETHMETADEERLLADIEKAQGNMSDESDIDDGTTDPFLDQEDGTTVDSDEDSNDNDNNNKALDVCPIAVERDVNRQSGLKKTGRSQQGGLTEKQKKPVPKDQKNRDAKGRRSVEQHRRPMSNVKREHRKTQMIGRTIKKMSRARQNPDAYLHCGHSDDERPSFRSQKSRKQKRRHA